MKRSREQKPPADLGAYRLGRDEMNLAEFPLSPIADRFLDGTKTVVFHDDVWDAERRGHVPRELAISGSDPYGLPTAKDDDVLLACVQLSSLQDFASREVHFSRYGLLKLLRWEGSTRNYRRLLTSLRRWKGMTIYSSRAFYDHGNKSWLNGNSVSSTTSTFMSGSTARPAARPSRVPGSYGTRWSTTASGPDT